MFKKLVAIEPVSLVEEAEKETHILQHRLGKHQGLPKMVKVEKKKN